MWLCGAGRLSVSRDVSGDAGTKNPNGAGASVYAKGRASACMCVVTVPRKLSGT